MWAGSESNTWLITSIQIHSGCRKLLDLRLHLLGLLRRHRFVDDAQKLLLICVDQRQQLRVLLAQLLQQARVPEPSTHESKRLANSVQGS